ncbi:MAG: hypothetical protein MPN21_21685 [Thermoanaerobaculia bacterium]|nr:hypothetical protein [Thermoanaerobaculia bacterium]
MSPNRHLSVAGALALLSFLPGHAQAGQAEPQPLVEYPASSDFMVLELTSRGGATVDPTQGPFLRIFGDGRVHVRLPAYVRLDPGDHEAYLSHSDLQALLAMCASKGLTEFDRQAVEQEHKAAERARFENGSPGEMVSDSAHTILTIRLAQYAPVGSDAVNENFKKSIDWYALSEVASWYPELTALVHFHEFVEVLDSIRAATIAAAKRGETSIWLPALDKKH